MNFPQCNQSANTQKACCRDLKSLYEEVVKGGLVSDADFWRSRQDLVTRRAGGAGGKQQVVGLSSALLAQIQPGTDGKSKQVILCWFDSI